MVFSRGLDFGLAFGSAIYSTIASAIVFTIGSTIGSTTGSATGSATGCDFAFALALDLGLVGFFVSSGGGGVGGFLILKELSRISRTDDEFVFIRFSRFSPWVSNSLRFFLVFELWHCL